jgi:hypothetical protein
VVLDLVHQSLRRDLSRIEAFAQYIVAYLQSQSAGSQETDSPSNQ